MPELPEVTIFKQYVDETSLHQEIEDVAVQNDFVLKETSGDKLRKFLKGDQFESTERHGKYLFLKLAGKQQFLMLHFGMTGSLSYYKATDKEPDYARIIIEFSNGYHLSYNSQRMLGEIRIVDNKIEYIKKLNMGPDALDVKLTDRDFKQVLNGRKGIVKSVLMNQEIIAGIGNEFSDEILFQAHIHPKTKIQDLSDSDIGNLYKIMRDVLNTAIKYRTNYSELKKTFLSANREKGSKCPVCHTKLETIKVSGRTAYYCPECQALD